MQYKYLGIVPLGSVIWLCVAAPIAHSSDATDAQGDQIAEIIVTAQKRSERLQDVPISVAALTSTQLTDLGITSTKDLEFVVPSLVTNELAGYSQTYLRGVGTDIQSPGAEPGVATYVDGVYSPFVIAPLTNLLGVDRTEVLYGPQGTLYGRNAVGGAINIITPTPTQEFNANGSVTVGNFARKELSGYISGGVSNSVAVSLTAAGTDRETYYSYAGSRPPDTPWHEDNAGVRLKVLATPSDSLRLTGTLEYDRSSGLEGTAFRQLVPYATGFVVGAPLMIQYNVLQGDYPTGTESDIYKGVFQIDQSLGWADLVSVSAYQSAFFHGSIDVDATSAQLVAATERIPKLTDASEEFRLQSPSSSNIQWVGGLYYDYNANGYSPDVTVLESLLAVPNIANLTYQRIHSNSSAVFGQVTFPIIERLELTLGGRYSRDQKEFQDGQTATLALGPPNTVLASQLYPNLEHTWGAFTPKATLSYKFTPDILGYVTFAEGYKSGQYQPANPPAPGPVGPEKLYDWEGGFKADLLQNHLRVNASAFHYTYNDLQVYTIEGVGISTLGNAAQAKIYGGDLSLTGAIPGGFTLGGTIALNHGTYTSFRDYGANVPGAAGSTVETVDATGNPVQRLPDRTLTANAGYRRSLPDGSAISATTLWSYNSGFSWDPSNIYRQKAYNVANARLEYTLPNTKFSVAGWVNNAFNRQYERMVYAYSLGLFGEDAPPRMYGLTLSYKY